MKIGTMNTGISTSGSVAIGAVVTGWSLSEETADRAEAHRDEEIEEAEPVPADEARLDTNAAMRHSRPRIHGAVAPIAMSPRPAGHAKKPGRMP